jgi:hypothetical protein
MNNRAMQQALMMLICSITFSTNAIAMYAPSIGRFCLRDPVGFDGSEFNIYEYTDSNPCKGIDPTGERTCTPVEHAACNSACIAQKGVTGNAYNCSTSYIINWGCFKWGVNKAPCNCHKPKPPQNGCKPCSPPVGSIAYRVDGPNSPPHNDPDGNPIPTPHSHVYVMNQSPPNPRNPSKGCVCFWVEVLKDPLPGSLLPAVTPASVGGPI